jgi:2-polyprenyl-6-methoxyphenol hydroxylase-like FAD-dependent oxidoreductase
MQLRRSAGFGSRRIAPILSRRSSTTVTPPVVNLVICARRPGVNDDAAHAVSPNAGQAASLALEDAMYLAKLLRDCADHKKPFARFERERKPRAERIVAAGRRIASDKAIVSPLKSRIRNFMMSAILRLVGIPGQDWAFRYRIQWN